MKEIQIEEPVCQTHVCMSDLKGGQIAIVEMWNQMVKDGDDVSIF